MARVGDDVDDGSGGGGEPGRDAAGDRCGHGQPALPPAGLRCGARRRGRYSQFSGPIRLDGPDLQLLKTGSQNFFLWVVDC